MNWNRTYCRASSLAGRECLALLRMDEDDVPHCIPIAMRGSRHAAVAALCIHCNHMLTLTHILQCGYHVGRCPRDLTLSPAMMLHRACSSLVDLLLLLYLSRAAFMKWMRSIRYSWCDKKGESSHCFYRWPHLDLAQPLMASSSTSVVLLIPSYIQVYWIP